MSESQVSVPRIRKHEPLDYEFGYAGLYDSEHSGMLQSHEVPEIAKRIEVGLFAEQLRDDPDMHFELPSVPDGEQKIMPDELDWLIQDGKEAMDRFVMANVGLVVSIAKRYQGNETPFLDLIQEGMVGLMKAVQKFDYSKKIEFSTFANDIIWQSIQQGVANNARLIYVPRNTYFDLLRLRRMQGKFLQATGRKATVAEMAERMDKPEAEIERLSVLPPDAVRLEKTDETHSELTMYDKIIPNEDTEELLVEGIIREQIRERIHFLLGGTLDERAQRIIKSDFGIQGAVKERDADIAEDYGVSRQAISLSRRKAMSALGKYATPELKDLIA